jgi:hypothetical protein
MRIMFQFFNYIINRNDDFESEARSLYFGDACKRLPSSEVTVCEQSLDEALLLVNTLNIFLNRVGFLQC